MNDSLGMALTKVLIEHEPKLLVADTIALARAASQVASLLGNILAGVRIKDPDTYEAALKILMKKIDDSAKKTVEETVRMALNKDSTTTQH